ncbi:MAG: uncharacterized protein K0S12_896, partial [Bacteroidetes bacterium]|jgi:ankyrin repeat protein|nr:uncharacterized protein [Bacteroidota bacterium]
MTTILKKILPAVALITLPFLASAAKPSKELYEGITKGNLERVKKAVEDGADVNKKISMEYPLMWALKTSHRVDIIKFLIDKGADVNASDIKGSILSQYAGIVETPEKKAKWLMDFYKKYKVDSVVDPKIYSSITDVVNLLLDSKADPNEDRGTIIGTPLHSCLSYGVGSEEAKAEFVKAMCSHKTNPANGSDRMKTAESVGANSSGFKFVDREKHPTPLMYCIQKGYTLIALALIESKVDLNTTMNTYKMSSDMWGVYNNKSTITALDIARAKGNKEVEEKLIAAGAI